jgi:hypothetical protein
MDLWKPIDEDTQEEEYAMNRKDPYSYVNVCLAKQMKILRYEIKSKQLSVVDFPILEKDN